jgi:protein-S-isoprenylcysteine O-methyltransferase Ste14
VRSWMYPALVGILWLAWLAYWIVSARNVKAVSRRETAASRLSYTILLLAGGLLMGSHNIPVPWLNARLLPRTLPVYWTGIAALAAGLIVAVWARGRLGGNWSATVTIKDGHDLIRTGPYAWVRHPIYSGLLLALLGTAITIGEWRAFVALAFFAASFVFKLRLEERFLGEAFGEDYTQYRAEVPALVPFVY